MSKFRAAYMAIFVSIMASNGVLAQLNTWERTHPDGPDNNLGGYTGSVSSGADGVTYMYSGFNRYYSRPDNNAVWENYQPRIYKQIFYPYNYFPHPTIPGRITANGSGGMIVRSLNYGRNWAEVSSLNARLVATSPIDPSVFYAAASTTLYYSPDEGVNWTATEMANISGIGDLEVDSFGVNVLYALDGQRIKKSIDGGANWAVMQQGTSSLWYMNDLAIDTQNPQKLFAASGASAYLFRTLDGAANWSFIDLPNSPGTGSPMSAIKIDPSNSDRIYTVGGNSSAFTSSDGGENWTQYTDANGKNDWYAITIAQNGAAILGGTAGVAVPMISGALELSNQGFSDLEMKFVASAPHDPRFVYGGGNSGLALYDSVKDIWKLLDRPFDNHVRGIAVNPNNSENLVVATFFGGLHESTDAGETWQEIELPEDALFGLGIAIAPSNTQVIYLRTEDGLHRSEDRGGHWELILESDVFDSGGVPFPIVVSPVDPDTVYVGTWNFGLFTTRDGGDSWKSTQGEFPDERVTGIVIDRENPERAYATLYGGYILHTLNAGISWAEFETNGLPGTYRAIALDSHVIGRIFLVVNSNQIWVYEPTEESWNAIGMISDRYCGLDSCQVIPDLERQGYVTVQIGGELFSIQRDSDLDQLGDNLDNCTFVHNVDQRDTDNDGYGNFCDADFNNDLIVNFIDLGEFANAFQTSDPETDMNGDGVVNFVDFDLFKGFFLKRPGPGANGLPD